jgi:hypothetical protein
MARKLAADGRELGSKRASTPIELAANAAA